MNSLMVSIFGLLFLHFEDPVNKGQIFNFYRHFIYENFIDKNIGICGIRRMNL